MAVIAVNRTRNPRGFRSGGLSLIEAVISMVIVATLMVMALSTLGTLARARQVQSAQCRAPALARRLMSEIFQTCYEEPDATPVFGPESPEAGYSRADYDDVDDYNGWSASPPRMKDGTVVENLTGWTRSVTVQYVDPDSIGTPTGSDYGLKRITVTVTDPRGDPTYLVALRSRSSIYDQQPASETTYVSWAGVELQIGSDPQGRAVSGANILNLVALED